MSEERLPDFSKWAARAHGYQSVETENGRRQNERQGDNRFQKKFSTPGAEGEAIGKRQGKHKKKDGDSRGEAEGEKERFGVHGFCLAAAVEVGGKYP
jgi:hypothetical protein